MNMDYSVVYRNIQYPRLEFKTGDLLLILPDGKDKDEILNRHSVWIEEKTKIIENALLASKGKDIYQRTDMEFKEDINQLISQYFIDLGKKPKTVFFKTMNSKWASCSKNENITVNMLLKYLPERLLSYVIYHEMVHLLEKRHNTLFWNKINEKFSDWKSLENDLFIYWFLIQKELK